MIYFEPNALSFHAWERELREGYVFDYLESGLHVTVEVVTVQRGPSTTSLTLRITDATYSRRRQPTTGHVMEVAFRNGAASAYLWHPHRAGYFARHAAHHHATRSGSHARPHQA